MSLHKTIYIIICCFWVANANSQTIQTKDIYKSTPSDYVMKVKQFGEFIDRFNYKSDVFGNKIDTAFERKITRSTYIHYLFNLKDSRFLTQTDSSYFTLQKEFISYITDKEPQKISLFRNVLAEATVNILYQRKNTKATIYFTTEVLNDRSAKWVISKVITNCFSNINDSLTRYFIAPNSNETNFLNVKRLPQLSNPLYFAPTSIASDPTMLFITETGAGRLKIENIEKIAYHVFFPEWKCTVDEFVRDEQNAGWLISDITKTKKNIEEFLFAK